MCFEGMTTRSMTQLFSVIVLLFAPDPNVLMHPRKFFANPEFCAKRSVLFLVQRDLAVQLQSKLRREDEVPERETMQKAKKAKRVGKAPTTQAGEFVREEIHHVREGKHGARSTKQAIAIGLSKARRAGVELPPPEK